MRQNISLKVVYIAAFFAVCFLGLLVRLWIMQVDSDSIFRDGARAVRARRTVFFPSRARILDREGNILVDNRSQWEVHGDLWALFNPTTHIDRARAYSNDVGELAAAMRFHQERVLPVMEAEYPSPSRPNLFFALWELTKSETLRADRQRLTGLLAETMGVEAEALDAHISLVCDEVDAIYTDAHAGRISISKAYSDAKRALRDGDYWQEIIRFPKSVALEPLLERRVELADVLQRYLEVLKDTLANDPANCEAYLKTAVANCRQEEATFAIPDEAPEDPFALDTFVPFAAWPSDADKQAIDAKEHARFWAALRNLLRFIPAESAPSTLAKSLDFLRASDEAVYALREGLGPDLLRTLRDYRAPALRDRLAQLRVRLFEGDVNQRNYQHAYEARWVGYLAYDEQHPARLEANPLRLAKKVARESVEPLKLYADRIDGLTFVASAERIVRESTLMPHLVGTVAKPTPETIDEQMARFSNFDSLDEMLAKEFYGDARAFERAFRGTVAEHTIGINGVEGFHEARLAGQPGARSSYVDARGRVRSIQGEWPSRPNPDLQLTIDADTQRFALETFKKYEKILGAKATGKTNPNFWGPIGADKWSLRGGFAMIDVETGAIIAMISFPSYDPELLASPTIAGANYREEILRGGGEIDWPKALHFLDKAPMYDRVVAAKHAPGSTFKLIAAIAGLESGAIDESFRYNDIYEVNKATGARVGKHREGKPVDIVQAIAASDNGFFYELSSVLEGRNAAERYRVNMLPWMQKFGFGTSPGLDIAGPQSRGNLPDGNGMSSLALANIAIGQGEIEASLLQVLRFYSAVATKGYLPTPHLSAEGDFPRKYVEVSPHTWDLIHKGLRGALERGNTGEKLDVNGTANSVRVLKTIRAAGKTGTAQVGSWKDPEGKLHQKPDHAWFAGFAPYDKPKVAFVGLAEYSGLFGSDVGALCGEIAQHWLDKEAAKTNGGASVKASG